MLLALFAKIHNWCGRCPWVYSNRFNTILRNYSSLNFHFSHAVDIFLGKTCFFVRLVTSSIKHPVAMGDKNCSFFFQKIQRGNGVRVVAFGHSKMDAARRFHLFNGTLVIMVFSLHI